MSDNRHLTNGPKCDSCGRTIVHWSDEEVKRTRVGLAVHKTPSECAQARRAFIEGREYQWRMTKAEILKGLEQGRVLVCDRKDAPLLPWLLHLVDEGKLTVEHVDYDEQSSALKFRLAVLNENREVKA